MANMFTNYDNPIKSVPYGPHRPMEPQKGTKLLTNIKGKVIGIQADHASSLQLYFHLENLNELEINDTWAELIQGTTVFEILTTTRKEALKLEYLTAEVLDQYTADLFIFVAQEEIKKLKKETYTMRVTLKTVNNSYEVFAEKDGYLTFR